MWGLFGGKPVHGTMHGGAKFAQDPAPIRMGSRSGSPPSHRKTEHDRNMKTIVRTAALSAALLVTGLAAAQETAPVAPATNPSQAAQPVPATRSRVLDGWRSIPLGMLIKQLALTPEQTQKGKDLNSRYLKAYQALAADMPIGERKAQVAQLMSTRENELKAMFTAEQLEKYKNLRTPSGELRAPVQKGTISKEPARMEPMPTAPSPAEKKTE